MTLSDSRSPVLDYAAANPVPAYRAPTVIMDHAEILGTEDGFDIITEDGKNIGLDT